ncbi:radical SAM protein [Xiamenia xianingshaonis]|uniref:Radical SAM protein n=1 Tax=Xiamenia xianingshaonis TaxID=2682776 RepID=A0A9E6MRI0_9ACTN|nr:radical SAM protein [Xiamenia xianingshaonis]NHM13650.1 radical SAM protein [Xiamenia xianingshaonis]QTU85022.1 radical SAM protein [Xiamenia xianingshaonis]
MEKRLLHKTGALCPTCLKELPARVEADADDVVWMERTCPEHGTVTTRIWPDAAHYEHLRSLAFPKTAPRPNCAATRPCPFGCGTCSRHERRGTLLEIEVTRACNLHCPVCFMSAEDPTGDPTQDEIAAMYEVIANAVGTDAAVQLTGGEPTCRADLPDIVRMGRARGFWGIEVNTNGLVIASRKGYVEQLVEAGLTGVYLSFDGLTGSVYEATCGRDILDVKLRAIERCREAGIQVVLSVAVMAGVNDGQLGDLLRFALENADVVAGLALQPAFTSGRFEADVPQAMTAGDVIFGMAEQSDGLLDVEDFWPLGCSNPLCDTGQFLVRDHCGPDERFHRSGFYPASRVLTFDEYRDAFNPSSPQGSVIPDILSRRGVGVSDGLSIIVMNYMDAYTMDAQRLRECSMMVTVPDGRALPFCSYHLTDAAGRRVYAPWCKEELRDHE